MSQVGKQGGGVTFLQNYYRVLHLMVHEVDLEVGVRR